MPLLNQDQADQLLAMNQIRQDQYNAMFPQPVETDLSLGQTALPPIGAEPPADPNYLDPLASQRAFWKQKKEKDDAAIAASEQRIADAAIADQQRKMNIASQMGYSKQEMASGFPAFKPAVDTAAIPTTADPYAPALAGDQDALDQETLMSFAAKNYPGAGAYGQIGQGIENQGRALREHSREQALEYQNTMDQIENYNKDQSIDDIAEEKQSEAGRKELETMQTDLASQKIDTKRLFANAGTGDKILAWTALILGGIGGGGKNAAGDVLERAISRDVDAQKADYETKRQGYENKKSLYGMAMDKFKNKRAAREYAKMGIYKVAELKLAQLGARYTDEATQGKVQEQLGKLQLLKDQAQAAYLDALRGSDDPYKKMDENQAKRYVPGYGFAPDADRAKLANAATAMADNTISSINTILDKAKNAGRFDFGANNEIGQLVQLLRSANREAVLGPGTVQEAERTMLEDLIKNPGEFFTNRAKSQKALEVIRDAAARTRDNNLRSYGVRGRQDRFNSLRYNTK